MKEYSPVKTFNFTQEEIESYLGGKVTFEELTSKKEPVDFSSQYSEEFDKETYYLMRNQGMRDIDIARHYGITVRVIDSQKAEWVLRSGKVMK